MSHLLRFSFSLWSGTEVHLQPDKSFVIIFKDSSGVVVHACNFSTWEVEAEGSEVQGHPPVRSKFEPGRAK